MSDEPFSDGAPHDARRNARRLVAGGLKGEGVVEADDFHEYENLERLELREGTLKIGNNAFSDCKRLRRVDSPSSLRTIDDFAFLRCSSLSEMNLPEGLQWIGYRAFLGHSFGKIAIPSSVLEIGNGAFACGKNLGEVTLAGGMVTVGRNAFHHCQQLQCIATPPKVVVVEDGMYGNGRAEVVTGGAITPHRHAQDPARLILTSPYLASMKSADVDRVKDAVNRVVGVRQVHPRFLGLLSAIAHRPQGEGPLDLAAGKLSDWIRVRRGANRIRSLFRGLLSAHRRAIASILARAPTWESEGGGVEPGVIEIIMSFLGDVEG